MYNENMEQRINWIDYLIKHLIDEKHTYINEKIPVNIDEKWLFLRSLMNIRPPLPVGNEYLTIQDKYLQEKIQKKGITCIDNLQPFKDNIYLWQGDITTLKIDAIVNAANSKMLGCFMPCHSCIDNAIHTFAGVQLRLACLEIMNRQGCDEEIGNAKITPAFNLPCKYVIHTVGPMIQNKLTENDCNLLASCYYSCLALAAENGLQSIALCCISTGEFHFPNKKAAEIAVKTVSTYLAETQNAMKVVFNVYKEIDYDIYKQLLTTN